MEQQMTIDQAADLLGVCADATRDEIAYAWRETAKTAHPDGGGNAEEFRRAAIAYELMLSTIRVGQPEYTDQTDPADVKLNVPTVGAHIPMRLHVGTAVAGLAGTLVCVIVVVLGAPAGSLVIAPVIITGIVTSGYTIWRAAGRPMPIAVWRYVTYRAGSTTASSGATVRSAAAEFGHRRRKVSEE